MGTPPISAYRPRPAGRVKRGRSRLAPPIRLVVALLLAVGGLAMLPFVATAASPSLTISQVTGAFYPDAQTSNGAFSATAAQTPVFTQTFPVINFDPPGGVLPCSTGVNTGTRPFTDVIDSGNGTTCPTIVAQGNGQAAGSGGLFAFQAAFTGTFTALGSGPITFNFYSDDGWILGVGPDANGHQPTYVSGTRFSLTPLTVTPIHGYSVVGAYNTATAPIGQAVTVNFPAAGTYPFEIDYTEVQGGELSLTLTANGQLIPPAPTVVAPASQSIHEGTQGPFALGSFSDALAGLGTATGPWNVSVNWGDGSSSTTFQVSTPGVLPGQTHTYADNLPGNAPYPVTVTVTNTATGQSGAASFGVTVFNVAPTVSPITGLPTTSIPPGTTVTAGANFSDPGTLDTHTAVWDWGDGSQSAGNVAESNGSGSVTGSHVYTTSGAFPVTLTVTDNDGAFGQSTAQVIVNAPPTADAGGPYSGQEGAAIPITGSAGDPDGDTVTTQWTVAADAGTDGTCTVADPSALSTTVSCTDQGSYTLTLSASDGVSTVTATAALTVSNAPIAVGPVTAPTTAAIGTAVNASAPFTDPGTADAHVATWNWGDGSPNTAGIVTETVGTGIGTVSDTHTYAAPGVYTVTVTVTDQDNPAGSGTSSFQVVVYQPTQFVIWGGNGGGSATNPNVTPGTDYTFWGAQWAKQVTAGDFAANNSFKGYADTVTGNAWTTRPGNASSPPPSVASYIGVIVSTNISKDGSTISGNVAELVVLKVDNPSAYAPNPGHPGTGVMVAVIH